VLDREERYSCRPVLLEAARFAGPSYKVTNWNCVGDAKGRAKLDVRHTAKKPLKSVWLLPLQRSSPGVRCR
jgi:hypothetical protein